MVMVMIIKDFMLGLMLIPASFVLLAFPGPASGFILFA